MSVASSLASPLKIPLCPTEDDDTKDSDPGHTLSWVRVLGRPNPVDDTHHPVAESIHLESHLAFGPPTADHDFGHPDISAAVSRRGSVVLACTVAVEMVIEALVCDEMGWNR